MKPNPIATVTFLLSFSIAVVGVDTWMIKNKMDSMEARLTKLELRVDKICAGKCQ